MKSKLFRGNLSTRTGEVSFFIPLYKNLCRKIWQKNHFIFLQEKESKLCLQEEQKGEYMIFHSTNNKCRVTNIYTERKKSIILHCFARKTKYHITSRSSKLFSERFLATFAKNHFILLREKKGKLLCLQEEQKGEYIIILVLFYLFITGYR